MTGGPGLPLAGRRALVTGASRGLGAAVAAQLAEAGVTVAVTARPGGDLERVAQHIRQEGGHVIIIPADLALADDAERIVADAASALGGLDVLINNASRVEPLGRFWDTDSQDWERGLTVNLLAPARLSRAALRLMVPVGWGRLLAISSGAAASPGIEGASAYSVAKTALEALTCCLAREATGTGVTVNAVRPGTMDTAMQERMRHAGAHELAEWTRERYVRLFRDGRLTKPTQVAAFVIKLLQTNLNGRILDVRRALDRADVEANLSSQSADEDVRKG